MPLPLSPCTARPAARWRGFLVGCDRHSEDSVDVGACPPADDGGGAGLATLADQHGFVRLTEEPDVTDFVVVELCRFDRHHVSDHDGLVATRTTRKTDTRFAKTASHAQLLLRPKGEELFLNPIVLETVFEWSIMTTLEPVREIE